jgi:hypothetical protein
MPTWDGLRLLPDQVVAPLLRALISIPRRPETRLILTPVTEPRPPYYDLLDDFNVMFAASGWGGSASITSPTRTTGMSCGDGFSTTTSAAGWPMAAVPRATTRWQPSAKPSTPCPITPLRSRRNSAGPSPHQQSASRAPAIVGRSTSRSEMGSLSGQYPTESAGGDALSAKRVSLFLLPKAKQCSRQPYAEDNAQGPPNPSIESFEPPSAGVSILCQAGARGEAFINWRACTS